MTALEHLQQLIRIPSPSACSNRDVIAYAGKVLQSAGWSTREHAYCDAQGVEKVNLVAAAPGQDVDDLQSDLVFVCHTDTVPYAADWSRALDPWIEEGMLHGCGSCDVKSVLACLLAVIEESPSIRQQIRLVLTAEEEIGCIGASHLLAAGTMPRARRMVVGEPTSLHPARAGKGYCLAEVTVHGREAHSAHPGQGVSAIYGAARMIAAIESLARELEQEQHAFFSPAYTSMNVGLIEGGSARNIVAGACRFPVEWRPIPGQPAHRVPAALAHIVQQLQQAYPDFHAETRIVRQQAGFETAAAAGLVQELEAMTGRAAVSIPFGSEASIFAGIADEVVVFGPGDMRTAHSHRECVPLSELDHAVECYRRLFPGVGRTAR